MDYYNGISKENAILNSKLNEILERNEIGTNLVSEKKIEYLRNITSGLKDVNTAMFCIYIFLIIVLVYFLYNKNLELKVKVAFVLVLLFFPFYITGLQDNLQFLYNLFFPNYIDSNVNNAINSKDSKDSKYKTAINTNYDNYVYQNSVLDEKIKNAQDNSVKNNRDSESVGKTSDYHNVINRILFYIYYICLIGALYELVKFNTGIYNKIMIAIILSTYPYYIDWIEKIILYIFTVFHSFIMVKPYKDPKIVYNTTMPVN